MRHITPLLLLGILSAWPAFAAVTLIDANTRNGSFEAGNVSPWQGELQAVQDAAFASEGSWFGRLIGTQPVPRRGGFQRVLANPTNGRTFEVKFDARTGNPGFDAIGVELFAINTNGSLIGTVSGAVTVSNLSAVAWSSYELEFEVNEGWNAAGDISLNLLFKRNAPGGTTYTGFLDHVTLQQKDGPTARTAVLQSFDRLFIGDDPSESFTFTRPHHPATPSALRFSGFAESLDLFDETGVRFLMGWGVTNNLEQGQMFPGDGIYMGVRLPPVDPVKGPVRVPLELQAGLSYGPGVLRFDVEGLGCCDNFRLVGDLTLEFEPRLRIAPQGTTARITWTTNWTGYQLESATNLPAVTWTSVTNAVSTVGVDYSVTVESTREQRLYRLRKP